MTRERKDYLVVVGTLHLVGPDSLIRMLDRAGYSPRQVGVEADATSRWSECRGGAAGV